jgi:2-polyprenyl-6-methoxyphenol hydroxylase-like FAD-dependent oxidoreductase
MTKYFDVCIRGDGVVGRALALLLAKERLKVALVTPTGKPPGTDIRAYALNSASKQLLSSLRVWPDEFFATPVQNMQVWGDDGGSVEFNAQAAGQEALTWIVDVPQLEAQLLQACSFQGLIETVEEPVPAPLSIICEGKKSGSRDDMGAQWTLKPYAQKAIAARLESDLPHGACARQWFGGSGEVLALLPMGGNQGNSLALVWSVDDEHAAQLENLQPEEFCTQLAAACKYTAGSVGNVRLISQRASWPLALGRADRWVGPGWALAGDAAHTVHPLAGQGLNLGLADAASLCRVLAGREYWRGLGDEKLLRRYERARKAEVAAVGAVTDGLQMLFAQSQPAWQSVRNWGMNGFATSQPLKNWLTKRATGDRAGGPGL